MIERVRACGPGGPAARSEVCRPLDRPGRRLEWVNAADLRQRHMGR